jgi:hypothetical protein
MQQLYAELDAQLTSLQAPHAWQARHAEMLQRLRALRVTIDAEVARVMSSSRPQRAFARMQARIQPVVDADNARLAEMGYEECSR